MKRLKKKIKLSEEVLDKINNHIKIKICYLDFLSISFLFCTFSEAQNNKAKDIRYRVQVQELASESPDWNDSRAMFTEKVATNLKLTNRANVFLGKK